MNSNSKKTVKQTENTPDTFRSIMDLFDVPINDDTLGYLDDDPESETYGEYV